MIRRHDPHVAVTLAAIAGVLAISACGSSNATRNAAGSNGRASRFIKFSACMRSHGVPNFPDPSAEGGIHLDGTDVNPASPSFVSAQATCAKLLPGGGPGRQKPSAQQRAQFVQIAECMRRHGISDFPDPTNSVPSNPADYSEVQDLGGVVLAIPKSINTGSPAYKQAATACQFQ
jgi:hypothetical protein